MPVAPRIVNDVSYVSTMNHDSHFAWQAQYSVRWEVSCAASRSVRALFRGRRSIW